ncbi:MAG TPA: bifunctional (p)ppGpp synthetase/guanosine-3',5'-bis(diphosphate) 3'-pyrophosphohydrolase [Methylococcaceae bacterium]|nr:bifunctional (p)ppGpp synthetase/guanosine-3',5'-bis(diphosphate) 3'-pyrophosphohydrolase [Methylococcaceae bacterium]
MKAAIQRDENLLLRKLTHGYGLEEGGRIAAALTLALDAAAQDRQIRPRGVEVAQILHGLKADGECVLAALLSDPYLRETLPATLVRERFGEATATLVDKVNWLNTFTDCREAVLREPEQAELLRRMLVAVVNDVRAVLVKLAYRVERLRVLPRQDGETRRCVAQETLDIFAPLANRLGVAHLKWELEDLSFRYLQPLDYGELARQLAETRTARESYIHDFLAGLGRFLERENIQARVSGRPKHLFSIWKKMTRKHVTVDDLYDLRAVRVIVENIADCYAVLGLVHSRWQHVPKEFDDYIANPKPNGYRSLHTVVIGPEGKTVEIQIRTREMHAFAEYGVAAHWRYKEGGGDASLDRGIALLRGLLESREDDHALLEDFRSETLGSDVFVLTPRGRIIRLPKGATPLDFAYAVHTEVGHRCRGAKVNGRMAPLTHALVSGQQVEILTVSQGGPSRHWLEPASGYLHTGHARGKVRQWFKQQEYEQHWRQGKIVLEREKQRLGVRDLDQKVLLTRFNYKHWDDLLAAVGRHEIGAGQVVGPFAPPPPVAIPAPPKPPRQPLLGGQIVIPGVPNPLTHFARCCNPQPGEAVVGYISVNRGVAVHRSDCANILRLDDAQRQRLIEAFWQGDAAGKGVEVQVSARDRRGLLRDVTQALSHEQIDIAAAFTYTDPAGGRATLRISVEKADPAVLEAALGKIRRLDGVEEARLAG